MSTTLLNNEKYFISISYGSDNNYRLYISDKSNTANPIEIYIPVELKDVHGIIKGLGTELHEYPLNK